MTSMPPADAPFRSIIPRPKPETSPPTMQVESISSITCTTGITERKNEISVVVNSVFQKNFLPMARIEIKSTGKLTQ